MMTDLPRFTAFDMPEQMSVAEMEANRFTAMALEQHKREGLELAMRARFVALAVVAVMILLLNDNFLQALYFEAFVALLAFTGYLQRRIGRVGRSSLELVLLFFDLALMTFLFTFPPPYWNAEWPLEMTYRFGGFLYFFIILAAGTLMYNWRTVTAIGNWTAGLWLVGIGCVWFFGEENAALSQATDVAFGAGSEMSSMLNPNSFQVDNRIQEIIVFLIVAYTLALTVRRFNRLILNNAALERTRANLSRYFSPNVVDELSANDTPLREVREQDVAVLFVDLVGFTSYAAERPAREVIDTLRAFHERMEACVFGKRGTLDKYLGDGLMATFGTPFAGKDDTARALFCARDMLEAVDELNEDRRASGKDTLRVSIGLHAGEVVLGDIGANRLEFAVIGNTVNVASRMEGLTRDLDARIVLSEAAFEKAGREGATTSDFMRIEGQTIRGLQGQVSVWVKI